MKSYKISEKIDKLAHEKWQVISEKWQIHLKTDKFVTCRKKLTKQKRLITFDLSLVKIVFEYSTTKVLVIFWITAYSILTITL